ncbi:MAG: ABC transporter substrate-binding protein [Anaerolineae bacterium]|nr:ABC transporter substrate-binding protein [Anaerolineae bacterium]
MVFLVLSWFQRHRSKLGSAHPRPWYVLAVALAIVGCGPHRVAGTVKIGLVAPFEGAYRSIGYDAIYAARLAVREINRAGGIEGWLVELVAYDDRGEVDLAERTAANLTIDRDVVAVIGHYRPDTSSVASPIYGEGNMPLLVLGSWVDRRPLVWSLAPSPSTLAEAMATLADAKVVEWLDRGAPALAPVTANADETLSVTPYPFVGAIDGVQGWTADYLSMGPHVSDPGTFALPTYEAVYLVAEAIEAALHGGSAPTRGAIGDALGGVHRSGWLGEISWDHDGYWRAPALYVYRWLDGVPELVGRVR